MLRLVVAQVEFRISLIEGRHESWRFSAGSGISFPLISWVGDPSLRLKGGSTPDDPNSEKFWISSWVTTWNEENGLLP
jgi:hypothetical protein